MLLTALLTLSAAPSPAETEQLRYTPATCSTDAEGKVYLRLNTGVAFGFPSGALKHLRGEIDFEPPPVANPADPEGCPGNPIITQGAYLLFHFARPTELVGEGFSTNIPLIVTIGGAGALSFGEDGYLRLQGSALRGFRTYKKAGNWCETTPAGWEACYPFGVREKPDFPTQYATRYVARPEVHGLRSGAPLTLKCWPPDPGGERECSSYYQPLPRVKVGIRFDDDIIPVEHFFALDRALTAWLEAARVPALDFEPPAHVLHRPEKDR